MISLVVIYINTYYCQSSVQPAISHIFTAEMKSETKSATAQLSTKFQEYFVGLYNFYFYL